MKNHARIFLADLDYRSSVNLKKYSSYIGLAVHTILEDAEVIVEENRFIILNDNLRNIEARAIGKLIASTPLGAYSIDRPILFIGKNKGKNLKEYFLADKDFRNEIDLTEYKKLIKFERKKKPQIKPEDKNFKKPPEKVQTGTEDNKAEEEPKNESAEKIIYLVEYRRGEKYRASLPATGSEGMIDVKEYRKRVSREQREIQSYVERLQATIPGHTVRKTLAIRGHLREI